MSSAPRRRAELQLAREAWTVALARHLAAGILASVGEVERETVQIAITEACSNAVIHADPSEDYQLHIRTGPGWCEVQVIDACAGFDLASAPTSPSTTATSGRGLALIRALTDQFEVRHRRPSGTVLRFVKRLP